MPDARNFFDELMELLSPQRLLSDPAATGEGVIVGVVDSGVDRAALEDRFRAAGNEIHRIEGAVFRPDRPAPLPYEGRQSAPHGSTVADIILTIAPRVKLYSADVFGPQGGCEVETVIRALQHCIDVWNCKIVNLSLGVPEHRLQQVQRRVQFQRAIEEAYFKDVLVFAAAHNEHPLTRSYPAVFSPPLISVDKGLFDSPLQFAYRLREQIEFQAHSRGYHGPLRPRTGDELGHPPPRRHRRPLAVAAARPEAIRAEDDPVLDVPGSQQIETAQFRLVSRRSFQKNGRISKIHCKTKNLRLQFRYANSATPIPLRQFRYANSATPHKEGGHEDGLLLTGLFGVLMGMHLSIEFGFCTTRTFNPTKITDSTNGTRLR